MKLRTVRAVRYVTPLREGGSLPAIVEADDLGLYVLKFRGAGQGPLALVAEIVGGEVGRALGLRVPELVLMEVDGELGRNEPDQEIRELLKRSTGLNVALDFLPGSTMFDPAAGDRADPELASMVVWMDAYLSNVDRTARNPNLLVWHGQLQLIDHGATLYWQHDWERRERAVASVFAASRNHVLLPWAGEVAAAGETARGTISRELLTGILDAVPSDWLRGGEPREVSEDPEARRAGYVEFLARRLEHSGRFVEEAIRARSELV